MAGTLRIVPKAIRHRIYLFVALVATFTLAAGLIATFKPPTYEAAALLTIDERFDPTKTPGFPVATSESLSDQIIQSASSYPVLQRACSGTYFDTMTTTGLSCDAATLATHVKANSINGPDWISVTVTSGTAAEAAAFADAVARAMIDQNKAEIDSLAAPSRDALNLEMQNLDAAVKAEQATIAELQARTPPAPQTAISSEQATLTELQAQYVAAYSKVQDLAIQENWLAGSLTFDRSAALPSAPIDPEPVLYVAIGLLAGLVIALIAVALVDRLDDRVFDIETLEDAAGASNVIAVTVRDSASLSNRPSNPYTVARARLLATNPGLETLMVVAASTRESLGPVGAGLGAAAVKVGQKVLLVDPEAPTLVMQQSGRRGSRLIVVSDPLATDFPSDDEQSSETDRSYDLTIRLIRPPDSDDSAVSLARVGDVAVVVATAGATRRSEVRRTADRLRRARVAVVGAILSIDSTREIQPAREIETDAEVFDPAPPARLPVYRGPGGPWTR